MARAADRTTELVRALSRTRALSEAEYRELVSGFRPEHTELAARFAVETRNRVYGKTVFLRGLIEFTNHCRNDCLYCGIRRGNGNVRRYRLSPEQILECCRKGHALGFRTFVLQGGEDPHFTDGRLCSVVRAIKERFPDCAVTLSVGERSRESYRLLREAGADRYLLRHESADEAHYASLHGEPMSLGNRMRCLRDLRELGYQVGCGFMVGSPGQDASHLARDLAFIQDFRPHMVGIGPFIPHKDTPLAAFPAGTLELTLFLLSVVRLALPEVLLPATTALGTIHPEGRELGIRAGANVCMPNLSPADARKKYELYDGKVRTGEEAEESADCLRRRIEASGCRVADGRGDSLVE